MDMNSFIEVKEEKHITVARMMIFDNILHTYRVLQKKQPWHVTSF